MDNKIEITNLKKKDINSSVVLNKPEQNTTCKTQKTWFKKVLNFLGFENENKTLGCAVNKNHLKSVNEPNNNLAYKTENLNVKAENGSSQNGSENFNSEILDDNQVTIGSTTLGSLKTNKNLEENNNLENKTSTNKKDNYFTKFFKIKHVKTAVIVLIFGFVALLILNSSFGTSLTNKSSASNLSYMTCLEYCEKLENKLTEVLGEISGVGNVKVMVTAESGPLINVATSTDERTNTTTSGENSTTNSTVVKDPIVISSSGKNSPLILSEMAPKITGVIVVASGAKDARVKLNLIEAIQALLDVSSSNIQIYY